MRLGTAIFVLVLIALIDPKSFGEAVGVIKASMEHQIETYQPQGQD